MSDHHDRNAAIETMWEGRFISAKRKGKWEFVSRSRGIKAAVVLAIIDGDVLLVEQFRTPLDRSCIELPAGLIGDHDAGEDPLAAAGRELEEETGYRAERLEDAGEFFSSPGMVSESFLLVRAFGLTQIHDGGGVDGEDIIVHRVPLTDVATFVAQKREQGYAIDVRIMMLPGLIDFSD
jgi:ADP-ribose pyrophosphatase